MLPLTNKTLEEIIAKLNQSPLFQLSLTSKELFHSNFLAWLATIYPVETGELFSRYLKNTSTPLKITQPHRELHNIDLTLEFSDGQILIIENKVKSLPNRPQLEEYSRAVADKAKVSFLLLSLTSPYFLHRGTQPVITLADGTRWHYASYQNLAEALLDIQPAIADANTYHGHIVADYINFIQGMDQLQQLFGLEHEAENASFFDFLSKLEEVKKLRLHDFIYKLRYAELAQLVTLRLEERGFEVSRGDWTHGRAGQVFIDSGMTRGTGLFDFKFLIADKESLPAGVSSIGVQLQHNAFRLVFEFFDKTLAPKIAQALAEGEKSLWFDLSLVPGSSIAYPKKGGFNQYSGVFLYRSKTLETISTTELVDLIVQYALLARSNQRQISAQIKNFAH